MNWPATVTSWSVPLTLMTRSMPLWLAVTSLDVRLVKRRMSVCPVAGASALAIEVRPAPR